MAKAFHVRPIGCTLLGVALATTLVAAEPASVPPPPLQATEVYYAAAPVDEDYTFRIACTAQTDFADLMFADALEFPGPGGWMPTSVDFSPRPSNTGRLVQVADRQVVYDQRIEQQPPRRTSWGVSGNSVGGVTGSTGHFAIAVWDGTLSCELKVEGVVVPMKTLDGSHAVYVGPETLSGGLFYQDGPLQASVGRFFRKDVTGPIMGRMTLGNRGGHGTLVTGDPALLFQPVIECNSDCSFGRPNPATFFLELSGAADDGKSGQALWLIDIPRSAAGTQPQ